MRDSLAAICTGLLLSVPLLFDFLMGLIMKCTHCGKEVILKPSAAERARKDVTGKSAAYFTALFPRHAACELALRTSRAEALRSVGKPLDQYC